jgi:hypothetical protein
MKENTNIQSLNISDINNNYAFRFQTLNITDKEKHQELYFEIMQDMQIYGYEKLEPSQVFSILNDSKNLCRNENLEKVISLIGDNSDIKIKKYDNDLNLNSCKVGGGAGFRVAMIEGFGASQIGNKMQTVITFNPKNITNKKEARPSDEVYKMKLDTAKVSLQIEGVIKKDDIEMISIRIPKILVTEDFMTEEECENPDTKFIVRHFGKK